MYTKAKYIIMMMLLAASFTGCSTEEIYVAPESTLKVEGYITSEEASRTVYNDNGEMVSVAWAANDMVGLLPVEQGKHLQYSAKESSGTTEFTPVGEELKNIDGQKVYAYYPYYAETTDYNHVTIPSNSWQDHNQMGRYDAMTATGVLSDNKLTLKFKHLYAFLKITLDTDMLLPFREDISFRRIVVSAQNHPISIFRNNSTGIYDFENDTIIAEEYRKYLNYEIDQKFLNQDKITCYIAILPISGNDAISVSSRAESETKFIYEKSTPSGGLKAGHVYELSVDKAGISEVMNLERDALIDFYNSTNGDNWTNNSNWCSERPISEWYGIGCEGSGDRRYVTQISLANNNLTGTIPESIKNFSRLNEIYLPGNYLTGNVPETIADLPRLFGLRLNMNCLSGTIPDKILSHPNWKMYRDNLSIQRDGYGLEFPVYRSSDYSQDRKLTTLQTHTKGSGLKIFIVGEMYTDRDIADGTYLDHAKKSMEYFFEKEPYTTFRDYFDVYCINVVSSTDVIGKGSAFNTGIESQKCQFFVTDYNPVLDIVRSYPETPDKDYTVIVLMNTRCQAQPNCHIFSDGVSVAFNNVFNQVLNIIVGGVTSYYETFDDLIHYLVCGFGFGKLAEEYSGFAGSIEDIKVRHENNYWMNMDYINDPEKVCWSYFMTDPRYRNENIGIYEYGLGYFNVYYSTPVSIMGGGGPIMNSRMFNAPSRRSIYQRIMDLSGETYSFEKFLEYDEINRRVFDMGGASRSIDADPVDIHSITAPPMFYDYPSTEAGMH